MTKQDLCRREKQFIIPEIHAEYTERRGSVQIRFNDDRKIVDAIREGLKKKEGHCPCRLQMTEDTVCMCREFREQIADPDFEGYCHCRLYYKEK